MPLKLNIPTEDRNRGDICLSGGINRERIRLEDGNEIFHDSIEGVNVL